MNILLFEYKEAAQEAAFMLRGEFDGCNAVLLESFDLAAVEAVANLVRASFCSVGAFCYMPVSSDIFIDLYASGCDLSGINLKFLDLSGIDLTGINLTGAYLESINLIEANLTNASFQDCYMVDCQLDRTILNGTNFAQSHIITTSFCRAQIENVNFSDTTLLGSDFFFCSLNNTDFSNTNLDGNNFFLAKGSSKLQMKKLGYIILLDGTVVATNLGREYLTYLFLRTSQHFAWKFYYLLIDSITSSWKIFSTYWLCLLSILVLDSSSIDTMLSLLGNSFRFGFACAFILLFYSLGANFGVTTSAQQVSISLSQVLSQNLSFFFCLSSIVFAIETHYTVLSNTSIATANSIFLWGIISYFILNLALPHRSFSKKFVQVSFQHLFKATSMRLLSRKT